MKKLVLTTLLATTALYMQAQKVTFLSEGFEFGVKAHLGLSESDEVMQAQTDTITSIDLSGLGISDISDVVYLPNVEKLDLSLNEIDDVEPLASLEHLQYVNLKSNQLESINSLAFALPDSMLVNVADNYISEFTYLFSTAICQFVLEGMGAQKVKGMPFWDVYMFYADIDENDKSFVMYRGNSNMDGVQVQCGGQSTSATMDSYSHQIVPSSQPKKAIVATISNGNESVTTYLVPPSYHDVNAGETITLETGLPDDYCVFTAYADYGEVEIEGNAIKYTTDKDVEDTIHFCYYQGETLKGFSRFYLNKVLLGDVNMDGTTDISDVVAIVNFVLGSESSVFNRTAADLNKDSSIDISDVVRIVNLVLGQ